MGIDNLHIPAYPYLDNFITPTTTLDITSGRHISHLYVGRRGAGHDIELLNETNACG